MRGIFDRRRRNAAPFPLPLGEGEGEGLKDGRRAAFRISQDLIVPETKHPDSFRFQAAELAQTGDVQTPLELGQLEVRVDVQVVYGLDGD